MSFVSFVMHSGCGSGVTRIYNHEFATKKAAQYFYNLVNRSHGVNDDIVHGTAVFGQIGTCLDSIETANDFDEYFKHDLSDEKLKQLFK